MWSALLLLAFAPMAHAEDAVLPPENNGVVVLETALPAVPADLANLSLPVTCTVEYHLPASGISDASLLEGCPAGLGPSVQFAGASWRFEPVFLYAGEEFVSYQAVFQLSQETGSATASWHLLPSPPVVRASPAVSAAGVHAVMWTEVKAKKRVSPKFPDEALRAGISSAICTLRFTIDEKGVPTAIDILSCPEMFVASVTTAAAQWRFEPMKMDGVPVQSAFNLRMKFVGR